jgi:hypothetical protein
MYATRVEALDNDLLQVELQEAETAARNGQPSAETAASIIRNELYRREIADCA